jgi:fluoride ion exporter CrcB/FEX
MLTNPLLTIVFGIGGIIIYFVPAMIANQKKHRQSSPILLVNLFFGWTILGWLIALIWSVSAQEKKSIA